jgi:hypothetical protein
VVRETVNSEDTAQRSSASLRTAVVVFSLALAADAIAAETEALAPAEGAGRLPADAAAVYTYVKKPLPGELKWQDIPWTVDLAEGMRLAAEERRPLLLFVSGDDPLERC